MQLAMYFELDLLLAGSPGIPEMALELRWAEHGLSLAQTEGSEKPEHPKKGGPGLEVQRGVRILRWKPLETARPWEDRTRALKTATGWFARSLQRYKA